MIYFSGFLLFFIFILEICPKCLPPPPPFEPKCPPLSNSYMFMKKIVLIPIICSDFLGTNFDIKTHISYLFFPLNIFYNCNRNLNQNIRHVDHDLLFRYLFFFLPFCWKIDINALLLPHTHNFNQIAPFFVGKFTQMPSSPPPPKKKQNKMPSKIPIGFMKNNGFDEANIWRYFFFKFSHKNKNTPLP